MSEINTLKAIIRDLTSVSGGQVFTAYREDVPVNHQEAIIRIWADSEDSGSNSDCGCGLGDKCPDPPLGVTYGDDILAACKAMKAVFSDPMTRRALGGHNEAQQEAIMAASVAIAAHDKERK